MRKLIVVTTVLFSSILALAATTNKIKRTRPPRRPPSSFGGIVEKEYSGKVLRIFNTQKYLSHNKLATCVKDMRWKSLLPFEASLAALPKDECLMKFATSLIGTNDTAAAVLIVEDEKYPIMLGALEKRWTILNISPLKVDNPSLNVFEKRFAKVLWIAVSRTLGAGYSSFKPCVMQPFTTVTELDNNPAVIPCPEPFNKMINTAKAYGIDMIKIASYRAACQEGWAPAPTNDIQKAIWDKVRATPKNPMKIEFDPKKGR